MRKKAGFTLIELLVVVSIISILSSIVFASLNAARSKARDAKRLADIHQIQLALELYLGANGVYPQCGSVDVCDSISSNTPTWGTWSTLQVVPTYISAVPTDPTNTTQYKYCYARGYKKTGSNTFSQTSSADYIIGMTLENSNNPNAVPVWSGCGGTSNFNFLVGN